MRLTEARKRRILRRRRVREMAWEGRTIKVIAEALGVNEKTVDRDLKTPGVVAWLQRKLRELKRETQRESQRESQRMVEEVEARLAKLPPLERLEERYRILSSLLGKSLSRR